ncbi:hypothetical protein JCM30471_36030 [Desulfuromonas carbonis]|uniref:ParA family protein n=1 Tax=Desulfuromonas sp. DDH964 TaxID=1823759 RepID=UPI00078BCC34|nr:ParA family protein [Desulfuromonas sp. DDH964]AMV72959.1 ParA family protein [Desulfuromonas sp. DDH964]
MSADKQLRLPGGGPYVVVVASEKGGVGKTTLATNLAVYLKALHEDLPVTIASFDNHFSVDNMFAIAGRSGGSVDGLFRGQLPEELATLGEYGVAFLSSARRLAPVGDDPGQLRRLFSRSRLSGVLILDTRPILDLVSHNALLAADLVLTPVKDRASLVNAAALQALLADSDSGPGRLWLVPSLIDGRLRLRDNLGMHEFLVWGARERGYQVAPTAIAKSPKVESLASGLSSRIYPVLTHARGTQVHGQFKLLAEFVIERLALQPGPLAAQGPASLPPTDGRPGLFAAACPLCSAPAPEIGPCYQTLQSRHRGLLHAACLNRLVDRDLLWAGGDDPAVLAIRFDAEQRPRLSMKYLTAQGAQPGEGELPIPAEVGQDLLVRLCGRAIDDLFKECLLVGLASRSEQEWRHHFPPLRRTVLETMRATGSWEEGADAFPDSVEG